MGEYEPEDSRNVTLNPSTLPGEPPRTGPREGESRAATPDGDNPPKDKVRQENLSQESTGGDLPDADRAARGYDHDEG
jgi:hypothetical protein